MDVYQNGAAIETVFDQDGLTVRIGSTTGSLAEHLTAVERLMTSLEAMNG